MNLFSARWASRIWRAKGSSKVTDIVKDVYRCKKKEKNLEEVFLKLSKFFIFLQLKYEPIMSPSYHAYQSSSFLLTATWKVNRLTDVPCIILKILQCCYAYIGWLYWFFSFYIGALLYLGRGAWLEAIGFQANAHKPQIYFWRRFKHNGQFHLSILRTSMRL